MINIVKSPDYIFIPVKIYIISFFVFYIRYNCYISFTHLYN